MDIRRLDSDFSVTGQIEPEDAAAIAGQGFRSILCNRPDGEAPGQPTSREIEKAAKAAGLAFRAVPVVPGQIGEGDVDAFQAALDELPGPVLAYCRSGGRAADLWNRAEARARAGASR